MHLHLCFHRKPHTVNYWRGMAKLTVLVGVISTALWFLA